MAVHHERQLSPELLDELPATDPAAVRSRRDLRRVNAWMGNAAILARMLSQVRPDGRNSVLAEVGGGDGTLLLSVARQMKPIWQGVKVEIIDRQHLVGVETIRSFEQIGWELQTITADVLDWLKSAVDLDVVMANLFLHHFNDDKLKTFFRELSTKASCFVACEPRRFRFTRLPALLLGLIGCNRVTRHDAVASVQAGFDGDELTRLWPDRAHWAIEEAKAGMFSHRISAVRRRQYHPHDRS